METITGTPPRADPHDLLDRERRRAQAKERAAARKLERSGAPPPAAADPLEGYGGTGGASINAASPDSSWSERAVPPAGLRASLLSDGASSDASSFWGAPGSTSGNRGPVTRRDKLLQTLAPFIVPLLLLALASLAANLGLGVHVYSSYADAAVPCRSSPCQNGGSCSAKAGGAAGVLLHSCSCRAGFAGTDCDSPTTHACSKASCAEGGRCNVVAGVGGNSLTAACACDAGFYGAKCDKKCEAMVDVATAPGLKTLDPSKAPHQEKDWTLVFSDEFDTAGRGFAKGQDDKWTAADRATDTDAQNPELQYYSPKQVTTVGGQLIITATKQAAPGGRTWQSGMLTSRSKFCMSGGVLETSLTLPGSAATGGFWPAAWLLGQLAEAGVKKSSDGVWPFSYSSCPAEKDEQTPYAQKISACLLTRPRAGLDGLIGGQGRGAPELDIVEGWVHGAQGNLLHTMHVAPKLPQGEYYRQGVFVAEAGTAGAPNPPNRPMVNNASASDAQHDALGAIRTVPPAFWTAAHVYRIEWAPGAHARWFVDGVLVLEVAGNALQARLAQRGAGVGPRLISVEPMFLIFNLALRDSWSVPAPTLTTGQLKVDYVRAWQKAGAEQCSCNPASHPTTLYERTLQK